MAAPQGNVQILVDGNPVTGATGTLSGGQVTINLPTSGLSVGTHGVTASYGGDGNGDQPSVSSNPITIAIDSPTFPTTTSVGPISPNEVQQGVIIPVTVTVSN